MPTLAAPDVEVPLADACAVARLNREQLLRRVQAGAIAGRQVLGRWVINRASLDAYVVRTADRAA